MTKKRQLKVLMPEVLPDPRPAVGPGGPRDRTLQQMRRLLALTAAGASLGACARPSPDGGGITPEAAASLAEASSTQQPQPPTPPPPATRGYAVVDPMPSPARCYDLASHVKGSARWLGAETLEIRLSKPSVHDVKYRSSAPASAEWRPDGATPIKKQTLSDDALKLELEVSPGSTSISLTVQVDCRSRGSELHVDIRDPSGEPLKVGVVPSLRLSDKLPAGPSGW